MRRIKRKASKSMKLLVLFLAFLGVFYICSIYFIISLQLERKYKNVIEKLEQEQQDSMAEIYVAKESLFAGDIVTQENTLKKLVQYLCLWRII